VSDKKVTLEHGEEYIISTEDFISIFPSSSAEIDSLQLEILYHQIGPGVLVELHRMASEIKEWFYGQLDLQEKARGEEEKKAKAAGDAIAAQLNETILALNSAREFQLQLTIKLENAERESVELRETLGRKEAVIKTLDERIALLSMESRQLSTEKEQLFAKNLQSESQLEHLLKLNAEFQTRLSEHESRITALLGEVAQLQNVEKDLTSEKAALQQLLKKKEDFIWELFKTAQSLEADYKQALAEIHDVKLSISYRTGRLATLPLRSLYGIASKKPFNQTNIWLFYHFLATGVKMPLRFLKNINGKNIVTLRKALAQEHPAHIYRNFVKLLAGGPALEPVAQMTDHKDLPALTLSPQQPVGQALTPAASPSAKNGTDIAVDKKKAGLIAGFRRTLIYMAPYLPDYDTSSGGKRATRILEMLALDYDVYVFTLGAKPDKYIKKLESLGVKVFRGESFDSFKLMVPQADFLVFSFFYTYFDCHNFLKLYPNAKVVVDTVDIHWVRHERSLGLWPELTADEVRKKKILEIDVYKKADVIWAVTEQDKQAVLKEVPDASVYIVSNVHGLECSEYRDSGNHNILFFGGFSHYPNIIAAKEIALNIFPAIRQQVSKAKLIIAGANAPEDIKNLGKLPGVEVLGFVEDSYVGELYKNTFMVLAPLQAGAGIKGKICEAISHMVPVATNAIGNEGIELVNLQSGLIADDNESLVELCVNALQRKYDLQAMTLKAQQKLSGLVGPEAVKKSISQSLSTQEVSICIVTWNKQKLLQRCIESIENHTHGIRYKILVHSNGCTDGTREYLEAAANINPLIVPILSDTNDVFVIPNNRMMQLFPENDVVLLNNDTYVTEGWLKALQNAAYSSDEIGIAGAKLLYPDGTLQEFGSELYGDGTGRNIGKWDDPNKEEYSTPKFSGYVSGCVFYVKRSTIDEIGVFDEDFHPCYCEDSDYCYTAWEHGIATVVTPDCVVYHDEGATSGKDTGSGFKAYQKTNFEKFLKKHGNNLDAISTKIKLKNLQQGVLTNAE
jgi:GT2 family glycosyltransferase/glycosyltransferase involved in cell wall biosynthesis/FtsZ-binding cell division protein ZapB